MLEGKDPNIIKDPSSILLAEYVLGDLNWRNNNQRPPFLRLLRRNKEQSMLRLRKSLGAEATRRGVCKQVRKEEVLEEHPKLEVVYEEHPEA